MTKTSIAIFASGRGSNALKIIEYFEGRTDVQIGLIISNKPNTGVLDLADRFNIPKHIITRSEFYNTEDILKYLSKYNINFITLAGFLWLIPKYLITHYPNKIINIHPAILPNYGGKGMYGMNVHEAVHQAKETRTGITIHYVNENYDEGNVVLQAYCDLDLTDKPEDIARKVLALEHFYFPRVIENLVGQDRD